MEYIDLTDKYGETLLFQAIRNQRIDIIKTLLENGANPNLYSNDNYISPLMYSAEQGYTNIVKLLLESGTDTELQDSIGSTALMIASGKNNVEIVKLLLKHDVNVNKKDNYFNTALHYACRSGNQHIIHLLLENNAEVNISGSMGTPLNIVTFYREKELVKLLLQYGARS